MSMTKKEQQQMEDLRLERDMYRAMYISHPVEPDMNAPDHGSALKMGWLPVDNYGGGGVIKACLGSSMHRLGDSAWMSTSRQMWSQGTPSIYSKKSAALRASREMMSRRYALALVKLDRQIEEAEEEEKRNE